MRESYSSNLRIGFGCSCGTFGELIQGPLDSSDNLNLVTLPIDRYAVASFSTGDMFETLEVFPRSKSKSFRLAKMILSSMNLRPRGQLIISSELPEGKGMASSTADMVATARAIENCVQRPVSTATLENFLSQIEPSDGVMHPGVVSYFQRRAKIHLRLGDMFSCQIAFIDEGGAVDTIEFNEQNRLYSDSEVEEYSAIHCEMVEAFGARDVARVGLLSSRSAKLNQRRNPKRNLDAVLAISDEVGALGVVVTHSGPCIGVMLNTGTPGYDDTLQEAVGRLRALREDVAIVESLTAAARPLCANHLSILREAATSDTLKTPQWVETIATELARDVS